MGDVARCSVKNEDLLYKLFGVNAELLIDHGGHAEIGQHEIELHTWRDLVERREVHVFALCSSTNIDRIAAIYHANPDARPMLCDGYPPLFAIRISCAELNQTRVLTNCCLSL